MWLVTPLESKAAISGSGVMLTTRARWDFVLLDRCGVGVGGAPSAAGCRTKSGILKQCRRKSRDSLGQLAGRLRRGLGRHAQRRHSS